MKRTIRTGGVYCVPLGEGQYALVTILGSGAGFCDPKVGLILVGVHNCLVDGPQPPEESTTIAHRDWCFDGFVDQGDWLLVREGADEPGETPSADSSYYGTYELFLDQVRQWLGLERRNYKGAEFTFSKTCAGCGNALYIGFARCPECGCLRDEFHGLERYVTGQIGFCCYSGARTDVRDSEGIYYWAPYFIDFVRAGRLPGVGDW